MVWSRTPGLRWAGVLCLSLLLVESVHAQLDVNLSSIHEENAEGYLEPLATGLSACLGSAAFTSGHASGSPLRFSIGVEYIDVSFDDADREYIPEAPPGFIPEESIPVPTVIGDGHAVAVKGAGETALDCPGGFDVQSVAIAVPQVTLGLALGTQVVARYVAFDLEGNALGELRLLGFGLMHSISQYLGASPVDVSVGAFFQELRVGDIVRIQAEHVRIMGSRSFHSIQPYLGLGIDFFKMRAEYVFESGEDDEWVRVDLGPHAHGHLSVGIALGLPVLKIHVEYSVAAENTVAIGIALAS